MAEKKQRKLVSVILNILTVVLLVVGLVLVFNKPIQKYLLHQKTNSYQVTKLDKKQVEANEKARATFDFDQVEPISLEAIMKNQVSAKDLPVIGGIAIPSVKVNLPIFKGLANEVLLYGAGTTSEQQKMGEGNYGLASHRMFDESLLFTPLDHVKVGDKIYLTDLSKIYVYQAINNQRVSPDRVDLLDVVPGKRLVTLVTCGEMSGETRRVIQGELKEIVDFDHGTKAMKEAFEMNSNH
ncbi:class A sortase [Enterococcus cecorum]|nr:class A sortase [Enterococcus cecorum]